MREKIMIALSGIAAIILARNLYVILLQLPDEMSQGAIWRIFYFHVPGAITASLCAMAALIASALYLVKKNLRYDSLAVAVTEVGLAFGTINLITGMFWGAYYLGYLVDLGCAPHVDAGLLVDVFRLSDVAPRRRGTHGARAQFCCALDLHFPRCLYHLEVY